MISGRSADILCIYHSESKTSTRSTALCSQPILYFLPSSTKFTNQFVPTIAFQDLAHVLALLFDSRHTFPPHPYSLYHLYTL